MNNQILLYIYLVSAALTACMVLYDSMIQQSSDTLAADILISVFMVLFPVINSVCALTFLTDSIRGVREYHKNKNA